MLRYKRLDQGTFRMPEPREPGGHSVPLTERELDALLDGIDVDAPARSKKREPLH